MLTVKWRSGMKFEAMPPSGHSFIMDGKPEVGAEGEGPSPVEALLCSAAGCSAMDVLSILEKKRQKVRAYWIEVEWERGPEGVWPRPVTAITVRHHVQGEDIDPVAVARAVELSDTKYCTVIATLRSAPTVTSEFRIEP